MIRVKYDDSRKFDDWSFVGLLVRNGVPHRYTGVDIVFPDSFAKRRADSIWECLTNEKELNHA